MKANDIIGSLYFVSDDDIDNKKKFMRMLQKKIGKLKMKMSEALAEKS